MLKIRKTTSFALLFLLSGCHILPLTITISTPETPIASDIPASTMPCVQAQSSEQSELLTRESIYSQAETALLSSDFEKLESYYSLYRQRTSRTPNGRWKLQLFYDGLFPVDYNHEKDWTNFEAKLLQWMKKYPRSPAAHIAYSSALINRAWYVRGDGYANEVPPEAWKSFHSLVELARVSLEESKEFASNDPQWYVQMLVVARVQGWSQLEVNKLLKDAVSKEPYYQETYQTAFEYLLPKWSGSFSEAADFADDAATITSKCEGRGMYARIYWRAINLHPEFEENPFGSKISWEKMKAGFEDIIALYPDAWNINNYARFACLAEDKETTRTLLARIGDKPILEAWPEQTTFSNCQKWASEP